jgi:hypothetical protein
LNGLSPGRSHRSRNFSSGFVPFWYDEPFGYEQPDAEAAMNAPLIVMVQPERQSTGAQEIHPAKPQIIEIPGVAKSASAKSRPPTIFVLTDGERLEARRYTLTAETLYVTVDRQQRAIPLALLELDVTVAANRKRGIELQIPTNSHEISIGF